MMQKATFEFMQKIYRRINILKSPGSEKNRGSGSNKPGAKFQADNESKYQLTVLITRENVMNHLRSRLSGTVLLVFTFTILLESYLKNIYRVGPKTTTVFLKILYIEHFKIKILKYKNVETLIVFKREAIIF